MAKLRKAFVDRDMIEMDGIDADSAAGGRNNGFRSSTLQVYLVDRTAARQKQRARRQDRPARQDHIAELKTGIARQRNPALRRLDMHVAGRSIDPEMVGKQSRDNIRHIGIIVPNEASRHLLERDDISTFETSGDTFRIVSAVETEAVLYVIARKNHDIL